MSQPLVNFSHAVVITKSDTVNFDASVSLSGQNVKPCDALYIGTKGATGTLVAILQNGVAVSFVGLAAGTILPIRAIRVNSTTTDTDNMLALYQV